MMKTYNIKTKTFPDVFLRGISNQDLEKLRQWKNKHKKSFFHQDYITKKQQEAWFAKFQKDENDFMFIVEEITDADDHIVIGCLGFRKLANTVDIYNVMRGQQSLTQKNTMSKAIQIICNYVLNKYNCDITCKVLQNNPAVSWYEKNCFKKERACEDYFLMKLDVKCLKKLITTE